MPIYTYSCPKCGSSVDKYQTMSEPHELTVCECGEMANRVWVVPGAIVDNTPAYFNSGLGCVVRSKHDIRDAQKKYKDVTGSEIHCIGDDKPYVGKRERVRYPTASEIGV